ncbi:MAG: polysaccharide pyruvyl transferase family protein [Flavobacterium sp.]|nr:polysaccharide pyruvyl transferase family protein [Flavobacterium sp.]
MKLGILTLPLTTNYGGLLQAYALQTVLTRLDHNVLIIDFRPRVCELTFLLKLGSFVKRAFLKWVLRRPGIMNPFISHPNLEQRKYIAKNTNLFIEKKLNRTTQICIPEEFKLLDNYSFDGYIVGSDQVWRSLYSPDVASYFLAFVPDRANSKRIAYAASFGVEDWEMTPETTKICLEHAKKFDAVSVRENTAVELCRKYLEIEAMQVLDPTFLLKREDYLEIIREDNLELEAPKGVFAYILDDSFEKQKIVAQVASLLHTSFFMGLPQGKFSDVGPSRINECVIPSVASWLKGFANAEYVVTDSFHGCVFSVIFNKPFLAIGNKDRGMTRFNSLLKMFKLENRLIQSLDDLSDQVIEAKIDYDRVNQIWELELEKSMSFLSAALKGKCK